MPVTQRDADRPAGARRSDRGGPPPVTRRPGSDRFGHQPGPQQSMARGGPYSSQSTFPRGRRRFGAGTSPESVRWWIPYETPPWSHGCLRPRAAASSRLPLRRRSSSPLGVGSAAAHRPFQEPARGRRWLPLRRVVPLVDVDSIADRASETRLPLAIAGQQTRRWRPGYSPNPQREDPDQRPAATSALAGHGACWRAAHYRQRRAARNLIRGRRSRRSGGAVLRDG